MNDSQLMCTITNALHKGIKTKENQNEKKKKKKIKQGKLRWKFARFFLLFLSLTVTFCSACKWRFCAIFGYLTTSNEKNEKNKKIKNARREKNKVKITYFGKPFFLEKTPADSKVQEKQETPIFYASYKLTSVGFKTCLKFSILII